MTQQSSKSSRQGIPFGQIGTNLKRIFYLRRFLILLVAQLLLVVIVPLMQGLPIGQTILHILTSIVLLAAILAVSDNRKMLLFAIVFSVPALTVIWLQHFLKSQVLSVAGYTIEFLFFGYTSLHIVMYIFRGTIVTIDRLFGAIC